MATLFPKRLARLPFLWRVLAYYGLGILLGLTSGHRHSQLTLESLILSYAMTSIVLGWLLFGAILPRVRDLGISPWLTLGFLVPGVAWALVIGLLVVPANWQTPKKATPDSEFPLPRHPSRIKPQWLAILLIAFGLLLALGPYWQSRLDYFVFGSDGEFRKDGLFSIFAPILLQIKMLAAIGSFYGLPLLLAGMGMSAWHGLGQNRFFSEKEHAAVTLRQPPFSRKNRPSILMPMGAIGSRRSPQPIGRRRVASKQKSTAKTPPR